MAWPSLGSQLQAGHSRAHIHARLHTHAHVHTHACPHTHTQVGHTRTHTHTQIQAHTDTHTQIQAHHTHTHVPACRTTRARTQEEGRKVPWKLDGLQSQVQRPCLKQRRKVCWALLLMKTFLLPRGPGRTLARDCPPVPRPPPSSHLLRPQQEEGFPPTNLLLTRR